jgi:aldose 1-epimerase
MRSSTVALVLTGVFLLMPLNAQPYSARRTTVEGVAVVELRDEAHHTIVSVAPSVGNNAYQMLVNGKNVFWVPEGTLVEFAAKPRMGGNPFLAPWANRIDGDVFFANGRQYHLNPDLDNLRRDANQQPIHGLLLFSPLWEVVSLNADGERAAVVSRLDFARHADLMAQFPFAHVLEMEYILRGGVLEVKTRLHNRGAQPMPIVIGYHPYFQLHDAPRDSWTVHLAADRVWVLDDKLTPTGETKPTEAIFPGSAALQLSDVVLDNVFGGLRRDAQGRAHFWVQGNREKIEVVYGPKFNTAIVYAPKGRGDFICFEPMTAITNAFNLAHRGIYKELSSLAPDQTWEESFWVEPSGF